MDNSDSMFQVLWTKTHDGLCITNIDGVIIDVNDSFCSIVEKDKKSLINSPFYHIYKKDERDEISSNLKKLLTSNAPTESVEKEVILWNGNSKYLQLCFNLINNNSNSSVNGKVLIISRDRTSIKEQTRSQKQIRIQRDLAGKLNSAVNLEEAERLSLEAAFEISGTNLGGIYLINEKTNLLEFVYHKGLSDAFVNSVQAYDLESSTAKLFTSGSVLFEKYGEISYEVSEARKKEGVKVIAVVPIKKEKLVIGCMVVGSRSLNEIPDYCRHSCEIIGAQIGMAISNLMAQKALCESEEKYRTLVDTTSDFIYSMDLAGKHIAVNKSYCNGLGLQAHEIIGKSFKELGFSEKVLNEWKVPTNKVLSGETIKTETSTIMPDGKLHTYEVIQNPIFSERGGVIGYRGICRDITEMKTTLQELQILHNQLKSLFDNLDEVFFSRDAVNNRTLQVSASIEKIFGFKPDDLFQDPFFWLRYVHPDDKEFVNEQIRRINAGNKLNFNYRIIKDRGEIRWIKARIIPYMDNNGSMTRTDGILEDITERRNNEEKIRSSLKEKDIMLKEIFHRVKNNLQIISSLLKMQQGYLNDKQAVEFFKISQMRIQTMALIHEQLYRSQNLSVINFDRYVKKLVFLIFHVYDVNTDDINLEFDVKNIELGLDTAIPCGLLITELVSNSIKHAFKLSGEGKIFIRLTKSPDDKYILIIKDNGTGIPAEIDFRNTKTMGFQIITTLSEQLDAIIELDRSCGTEFKISFSELKYKKRL